MTYEIKDSGKRQVFDTGARRDVRVGKGRFELLPPRTIKALAVHFEKGCLKYGDRNWEKGIPIGRYVDSALRHTFQFLEGESTENHLIAAIWNLVCAYDTLLSIMGGDLPVDLYDLPKMINLKLLSEVKFE